MLNINKLIKRLFNVSYKNNLCHLSSCISSLPILIEIYNQKKEDERFILSNGHAGLALYVILEDLYRFNAEDLFKKHGIHPNRDIENNIYCSTGSLGMGLPIALGMALSDRNKNVYCLISDGECAEGSIWESLRIKSENNINNLKIYVNLNGYGAYQQINKSDLSNKLRLFCPDINIRDTEDFQNSFPFLRGLQAHYYFLKESDLNA